MNAINQYYSQYNSNIHRGSHTLIKLSMQMLIGLGLATDYIQKIRMDSIERHERN
ncbi:hypothetical protein CPJCM30710_29400 [Clostridium polyendosporum]|uniref:Uncharacterized protein n=1 Tax=Clostridium polyendosporum TaxID=69208 RepID=A0A919S2I4_9CLOT|nr:hypothetical protein [Clostridium polyendosporum]GIM30274.1 hypothetical protein CPJCM30710_29400 [Clostridium polyendosporum]